MLLNAELKDDRRENTQNSMHDRSDPGVEATSAYLRYRVHRGQGQGRRRGRTRAPQRTQVRFRHYFQFLDPFLDGGHVGRRERRGVYVHLDDGRARVGRRGPGGRAAGARVHELLRRGGGARRRADTARAAPLLARAAGVGAQVIAGFGGRGLIRTEHAFAWGHHLQNLVNQRTQHNISSSKMFSDRHTNRVAATAVQPTT